MKAGQVYSSSVAWRLNMKEKERWLKITDFDLSKGNNCPNEWREVKVNGIDEIH